MSITLDLFEAANEWAKKLKDQQLVENAKDFIQDIPQKPRYNKTDKSKGSVYQELLKKQHPDNPICHCGCLLLIRTNKTSGDEFWGCSNYPDCTTTMRIKH